MWRQPILFNGKFAIVARVKSRYWQWGYGQVCTVLIVAIYLY